MKLATVLLLATVCYSNAFLLPKVDTVDKLDVPKYMGRFYEKKGALQDVNVKNQMYSSLIQRSTFQRNAVCTSATYTLLKSGIVQVYNSNRYKTPAGELKGITGTAKPTSDPGSFIVNFPGTPSMSSPNYLVIKLGPVVNGLYEYSVVSTPRKALVWILARDPKTFKAKYEKEVLAFVKKQGFTWFWNKPRETYQGDDCVYPSL